MVQPVEHHLKIAPEFFDAQIRGNKNFEIRKNDRNYHTGDYLTLREWDGENYTGRWLQVYVTYITTYAQVPGVVVLGTAPVGPEPSDKLCHS
ncbi:DUF3850 domain-containing protein [Lacticaseibacillus sp. GG6-2]